MRDSHVEYRPCKRETRYLWGKKSDNLVHPEEVELPTLNFAHGSTRPPFAAVFPGAAPERSKPSFQLPTAPITLVICSRYLVTF